MEALYHSTIDALMRGRDASSLIDELKAKYTLQSVATILSEIRSRIKAAGIRHTEYNPELLLPFAHEEGVSAFLASSVKEQERIQRQHRTIGGWSPLAEDAISKIKVLSELLDDLRLGEIDTERVKLEKERAQALRDQHVAVIPDAADMLKSAILNLEMATAATSNSKLGLALMLVSGRRMTEIFSQRSTFTRTSDHVLTFGGQLKKKGVPVTVYKIPLLCHADTFLGALGVLRAKQGDVSHLDEKQLNAMYGGSLRACLHKVWPAVKRRGANNGCPHLLRSVYAALVFVMYDHTCSMPYLYKSILGHASKTESEAYSCVKLQGLDALHATLGPLAFEAD